MHRVPPAVRNVLDGYVRLLRAQFGARVERVVLFGSYARGQAKPDSDVDVLVVIDVLGPGERGIAVDLAYDATRECGRDAPLITPLVWTHAEHLDRVSRERRIALDIQREGVPL
jgi:predicted nucleotidyltransferase